MIVEQIEIPGRGTVLIDKESLPSDYGIGGWICFQGNSYQITAIEGRRSLMGSAKHLPGVGLVVKQVSTINQPMKRKLLHFTNHLGKPAAVRAEDVLYVQEEEIDLEYGASEIITEICTYNGTKLIAQEPAEELIKALSEIIER